MLAAAEKQRLVTNWQNWRAIIAEAMDGIHDAIEAGNYRQASAIMEEVTMQQAQASLTMRSILVRAGVIIEGDDDD